MKKRFMYLILWLITTYVYASQDVCEINILDVGQGNCVLIKYNNQAIMVDAGSKELKYSAYYGIKPGYDQKSPIRVISKYI